MLSFKMFFFVIEAFLPNLLTSFTISLCIRHSKSVLFTSLVIKKKVIDQLNTLCDGRAHILLIICWSNHYVIKQEMARVNVNISGISKQKWTGVGEFNSDDHFIYYCGQESLRRKGGAIIVNKSPKCSTWMQSQKWQNDLCSFTRQAIQYHSNSRLCPN